MQAPLPPGHTYLLRCLIATLAAGLLLSACRTFAPSEPGNPTPAEQKKIEAALAVLKEQSKNAAGPDLTDRKRAVRIFAHDVQLPATGPGWELQEYSFYIWANHPRHSQLGVDQLVKTGLLHVDVTGAPVEKRFVNSGDPSVPADVRLAATTAHATDNTLNRDLIEIVVRAGEIREPLQIVAWFPTEFRESPRPAGQDREADEGPWLAQKTVSIRSGDLKTNIQIVDQREARAAFGTEFSNRYFVGRVYLRNANAEKKLVVYTTSMRVPVFFYHRSANPGLVTEMQQLQNQHTTPVKTEPPSHPERSSTKFLETLDRVVLNPPSPTTTDPIESWFVKYKTKLIDETHNQDTDLVTAYPKSLADSSATNAEALSKAPAEVRAALQSAWQFLRDAGSTDLDRATAAFRDAAKKLPAERQPDIVSLGEKLATARRAYLDTKELADELNRANPAPLSPRSRARLQAAAAADGTIWGDDASSPFDERGTKVGVPGRPLAMSSHTQQSLYDSLGYLQRDVYRPLTFQAVLNSLMLAADEATPARWYQTAEALSRVMGGLITLGPVWHSVETTGYARSVAFNSSVVVPELKRVLLDDLNKHIRNLGEMGMDTVMVIQPKSVVDRYVFFPRGPIFNSPDEFDLHAPSYIAKILDEDVFVEAELVTTVTNVNGTAKSADELVTRAVDEGKASLAADLARQNDVRNQAMASELANTLGKVEKALRDYQAAADDASKQAALARARDLVRQFRAVYKDEGNRAFSELFTNFGVKADDMPATLGDLSKTHLPLGAPTAARDLTVADDFTALNELKISAEVTGTGVTWKSTASADGKKVTYQIATDGATVANDNEERVATVKVVDKAGNETKGQQTIVLFKAVPKTEIENATQTNKTGEPLAYAIPTDSKPSFTVTIDVGDADTTGWSLACTSSDAAKLQVLPAKIDMLVKADHTLSGKVALDGSQLGAATATVSLQLKRGDKNVGDKLDVAITAKK